MTTRQMIIVLWRSDNWSCYILSSGSVYDTDMTDVLLSAPTELCFTVNVNNTSYILNGFQGRIQELARGGAQTG